MPRFTLNLTLLLLVCSINLTQPALGQIVENAHNTYVEKPLKEPLLDDSAVLTAQAQHAIKVEVNVTARLKKLLPEDRVGLPHQRFLIEL